MEIISQLITNSIIAAGIYALIAMGFNLAYGATKFFNLAHGAMAVIGGYAVFLMSSILKLDIVLSVVAGVLIAGAAGYLLDKIIYLPLRAKKASNMILLVCSLGVLTAIEALIALAFTNRFRPLSQSSIIKTYQIFGSSFSQTQFIIVLCAIVSAVLLILLLNKTKFGKAIKAVSDDEEVAKIVGIKTNQIIGRVFFISSSLAGLAGILIGFDTGILPTMGFSLLLKGVIVAIIGGVGEVRGAAIGALLLGLAENFGVYVIGGAWKDAIAFVLLILFLLFRPKGIWTT